MNLKEKRHNDEKARCYNKKQAMLDRAINKASM